MDAGRLRNRANPYGAGTGSALILTVVLTSLLAIVGVLFVMVTRIDKMGTQAVADNQELTMAVETLVAEISELLSQDVPGGATDEEYYDYPDAANAWLAALEPSRDVNDIDQYRWRQITSLDGMTDLTQDVAIRIVGERDPIVDSNEAVTDADADGDGVGDARWFQVPGIMSSKGRPIYAAVRIIDNGGMLNANTGFWFDPNRADPSFSDPSITEPSAVDGSSPLQINAVALAGGHVAASAESRNLAAALLESRRIDPVDGLSEYEQMVVWGYSRRDPCDPFPSDSSPYTPFDLADELELRYRGLINHDGVDTRIENWGRFKTGTISTPVDSGGEELNRWFARARDEGLLDPSYAYRHVATTYNMDRIITPKPFEIGAATPVQRMINVNAADARAIRGAIAMGLAATGLDPTIVGADAVQLTANVLDYIDDDDEVTAMDGPSASGARYYGFERPCIYISEIAYNGVTDMGGVVHHSYAIELHKPYFEDRDPSNGTWRLVITTPQGGELRQPIVWSGLRRFHVLLAEDPVAELFENGDFEDPEEPADTLSRYGYDRTLYGNPTAQILQGEFGEGAAFDLQRYVSATDEWVTVDYVHQVGPAWMVPDQGPRSLQRDISKHKCIRRLLSPDVLTSVTLGRATGQYVDADDEAIIQAHPANRTLRNIGELGMVFADSAYGVMREDTAEDVLLNLTNPRYAELFNYLTVIDPAEHGRASDETRIMGRININTAPWFVLAQLPWIQYEDANDVKSTRALAIVNYRDTHGPYTSTAGLMQVTALHDLASDDLDNLNDELPERGPDLTRDTARDDLEERDLLFTRMSNLVTVRSDVFTAYIVVRLGPIGPQKRMIAVFDRSKTTAENPGVKVVAIHPVADPR